MPTFEHGDTVPLKPAGAETPDILGRGNHSILGFIAVLDESWTRPHSRSRIRPHSQS